MVRRADWRRSPGDPETLAGWTLRAILEESPRIVGTTLLTILFVGFAVLTDGVAFFSGFSPGDLKFRGRRLRAPSSLSYLAPSPALPDERFPVFLRLIRQGVRTGQDEGVVIFFDGWLLFEGRRTTFAIRNRDALFLSDEDNRLRFDQGIEGEFFPYEKDGDRRDLRDAFGVALLRWSKGPSPDGEPVLPPGTVHPWGRGQALGATIAGAVLILAAFPLLSVGLLVAKAMAAAVALCGIWRGARGGMDLNRLRRIES